MPTETLRPDAVGTYTDFPDEYPNAAAHWSVVDDVTPDEDSSYITTDESVPTRIDTYNIPDSAIPDDATINSVTVYVRRRRDYFANPSNPRCYVAVYTHAAFHKSADKTATDNYVTTSETWVNNPETDAAWTKAEINALEIGVEGTSSRKFVMSIWWYTTLVVTQVYVVIDYTVVAPPPAKPLINKPLVNPILVNVPCVR